MTTSTRSKITPIVVQKGSTGERPLTSEANLGDEFHDRDTGLIYKLSDVLGVKTWICINSMTGGITARDGLTLTGSVLDVNTGAGTGIVGGPGSGGALQVLYGVVANTALEGSRDALYAKLSGAAFTGDVTMATGHSFGGVAELNLDFVNADPGVRFRHNGVDTYFQIADFGSGGEYVLGQDASATNFAPNLRAAKRTGLSNSAGEDLTYTSGQGTGNGGAGASAHIFKTPQGSAGGAAILQTIAEVARINYGGVSINTTAAISGGVGAGKFGLYLNAHYGVQFEKDTPGSYVTALARSGSGNNIDVGETGAGAVTLQAGVGKNVFVKAGNTAGTGWTFFPDGSLVGGGSVTTGGFAGSIALPVNAFVLGNLSGFKKLIGTDNSAGEKIILGDTAKPITCKSTEFRLTNATAFKGDRRQVSGASINALTSDFVLEVTPAGGGSTVTLPLAANCTSQFLWIFDISGGASGNPITIDGGGANINGVGTQIMNTDYAAALLWCNGTQWVMLVHSGF